MTKRMITNPYSSVFRESSRPVLIDADRNQVGRKYGDEAFRGNVPH
jgi:hypothetical protein